MCYRLLLRGVICKESSGESYRGHSASALDRFGGWLSSYFYKEDPYFVPMYVSGLGFGG